ncbi:MAG: hypothetical protein ACREIF_13855 [Chthoniobacterales bacterium]
MAILYFYEPWSRTAVSCGKKIIPRLDSTGRLIFRNRLRLTNIVVSLVRHLGGDGDCGGGPGERLIVVSAGADVDMIISSTHGYTSLRHALLGGVAEELARARRVVPC